MLGKGVGGETLSFLLFYSPGWRRAALAGTGDSLSSSADFVRFERTRRARIPAERGQPWSWCPLSSFLLSTTASSWETTTVHSERTATPLQEDTIPNAVVLLSWTVMKEKIGVMAQLFALLSLELGHRAKDSILQGEGSSKQLWAWQQTRGNSS